MPESVPSAARPSADQFVASVSSIAAPGVVPSPVAVAPPAAEAQFVGMTTVWVLTWLALNVARKR